MPSAPGACGFSSVSPDRKLIAYLDRDESDGAVRVVVIPFDGGDPVKTFALSTAAERYVPVRWTPDGSSLAYVETRDDVSNVWAQPLAGEAPSKITDFRSDWITSFDWSRDGKQLALWRSAAVSNVVLISDFR